jgi:hypothetical protein
MRSRKMSSRLEQVLCFASQYTCCTWETFSARVSSRSQSGSSCRSVSKWTERFFSNVERVGSPNIAATGLNRCLPMISRKGGHIRATDAREASSSAAALVGEVVTAVTAKNMCHCSLVRYTQGMFSLVADRRALIWYIILISLHPLISTSLLHHCLVFRWYIRGVL